MDPKEYQKEAQRTECNQNYSMLRMNNENPISIRLNHAVLGLAGEVGELAGAIERWLYYGRNLDITNIKEELGDCMWYIALACNTLFFELDEVMEANIRKLKIRYPEKYSDTCAAEENRNREVEMKAVSTLDGDMVMVPAVEEVVSIPTEPQSNYSSVIDCIDPPNAKPPYDNYQRLCEGCRINRIHKNNRAGLCLDCYMLRNPQSY